MTSSTATEVFQSARTRRMDFRPFVGSEGAVRGSGLRIGLDARLFGDRLTGVGHYVSELCKELDQLLPGAHFLLYAPWPIRMPVDSPRWRARIDPWSRAFERFRGSWATKHAWTLLRTGALCTRDRINVFWATDAPFIPLLPRDVRVVATVYDFRHRVVPQAMRRAALYGRLILERRLRRADAILTISEGTALKLRQFLGYEAHAVARPAVSAKFLRWRQVEVKPTLVRYGICQPYLLTIASADPHKNLELLIKVFMTMKSERLLAAHTLVLCGKESARLVDQFHEASGRETTKLRALGYVPDDDLPALYSGAEVFVLPSLDEGFGMPVLEARACETKIVTTDALELREAGGDRATYIRPDAEGIRSGILTALAAERPTGSDNLWTWKSSAQILADAIDPP